MGVRAAGCSLPLVGQNNFIPAIAIFFGQQPTDKKHIVIIIYWTKIDLFCAAWQVTEIRLYY